MARRTRAPMPVRRAAAFAASSAVLGATGHAVAGGSLPNLWFLLLGAVLVGVVVRPLVAREATWPGIVLALACAQSFLHGWMALLGAHHHHGATGGEAPASGMLLAHAAATVAAAVWLRYAEQRLWSRARLAWVRSLLTPVAFRPQPRLALPPTAPVSRPAFLESIFDPASWAVRGPPAVVCP